MDHSDRIVLIGLAVAGGSVLLVWAIVAGAFAAPSDNGWVYNYETLIGGFLALLGAGWTVWYIRKTLTPDAR